MSAPDPELARRVFILDDHAIVRRGLESLVATSPDLVLAGSVADGAELLARLVDGGAECDVLVLDLNLPRVSGAEVFARVRAARPDLPIIIFSAHAEGPVIVHYLREGAAAFLTKERDPLEVLAAIREVAHGGRVAISPLDVAASGAERAPHEALSPREYQIFTLVLAHLAPGEIAAALDLGPSTVSTHLARIRHKLGARTLADIVGYAHKFGLV